MSGLNWHTYQSQVFAGVGEISHISPDIVRGYQALGGASGKTGLLGAKVNELIALAVAVTVRCVGCIAVHTAAAVNAGAALVYSTRVLAAHKAMSGGRALHILIADRLVSYGAVKRELDFSIEHRGTMA